MPAQESISSLAREIIESQYSRPSSTQTLPITVDHVRNGQPQRVDGDATFDQTQIRDGDTLRVGYQTNAGGGARAGIEEQYPVDPNPGQHADKLDNAEPITRGIPAPKPNTAARLWMRAQTEPEIGLGRVRPVFVTIAREPLDTAPAPGHAAAEFNADPDQKLTVEVVPLANLEVIGSDRAYVDLSRPGQPHQLQFAARRDTRRTGAALGDRQPRAGPAGTLRAVPDRRQLPRIRQRRDHNAAAVGARARVADRRAAPRRHGSLPVRHRGPRPRPA